MAKVIGVVNVFNGDGDLVFTYKTEPKRITEVLIGGEFKQVPSLISVKQGDVFRQFEPDDRSPVLTNGELLMYAHKDAFIDEKTGSDTIECCTLQEWVEYENGEAEIKKSMKN